MNEATKIVNRLLESEEPRKPIDYEKRLRNLRIRQGRDPETGDLLPEDEAYAQVKREEARKASTAPRNL